jgi:hypothetical protein
MLRGDNRPYVHNAIDEQVISSWNRAGRYTRRDGREPRYRRFIVITPQASLGSPAAPGLGEDTGPHPVVRAVTGLLLGLGVGFVSAFLLPRRRDQSGNSNSTMTGPPPASSMP